MSEFSKYKVGNPSKEKNWTERSCYPMTKVWHVCHIPTAISIIQENSIKPRLIFDESKLNKTRTRVCWLSPNTWGDGYRYGNISFEFDLEEILGNKNTYWVETIDYKVPACRILITDKERTDLEVYDPTKKIGPWWYDVENAQHYYNNYICLEFMLENKILLDKLAKIDFVDHHSSWCSLHRKSPKSCPELGMKSYQAGAIFLATIISQSIDLSSIKDSFIKDEENFTFSFLNALEDLIPRNFNEVNYENMVSENSDRIKPIIRGILNALALKRHDEAQKLATLLDSEETVINTSLNMLSELMEYDNVSKIRDKIYP